MDEDGRSAGTRELRDLLRAPCVVPERLVERRIEGHRCGAVDDDVDTRGERRMGVLLEPQPWLRHVAGNRDDLVAGERWPPVAVRARQRGKSAGREHFRL